MVIAYYELHTPFFGIFHLFYRLNSAIERDYKSEFILNRPINTLIRDTITLIITVRYIVINLTGQRTHKGVKKSYCSCPINIIITIYENILIIFYSLVKPLYRNLHITHKERIMKLGEIGTKEVSGTIKRCNTSLHQKISQDLIYAEFLSHLSYIQRIAGLSNYPSFVFVFYLHNLQK